MPEPRAFVRNTADPQQVKSAARRERRQEIYELSLWKWQLSTYEGRAVAALWIRSLGVNRSCFDPHGGVQSMNIGRQNAGLELMANLIKADPEGYDRMEAEARIRQRKDDAETDAAHTPQVTGENQS